ncbi:SRPBCC family protein [Nostocales cyanobacterium LEGE 11386]|nr:SRPBCC family protein [Nostocales cyanobacterium LEGE 11386]
MRQTVVAEQEISGKTDAIWETISAGGNVHKWFPMVIHSCQLQGTGEGASRFCTMADGNELEERIVEVNHAARRFRYTVDKHPLPAKDVIAFIEVKNAGDGRTFISWGAEFEASEEAVPQVKETIHGLYMQGIQSLEAYHNAN